MTARRACAAIWIGLAALAAIGHVADAPLAIVGAWFGALIMLGGTGSTTRARGDERLERRRLYRITAAIAFAIPLATALLTWVPHHSEWTALLAPYFAIIAWLQYRALVARGPRPALLAMCVAMLLWLPEMVFGAMGCKCGHYVPPPVHWTEAVTWLSLLATQLCDGVLVATALVSFAHHSDDMPEARLQRPFTT